jgi:hypothetical protein
MRRKAYDGDSMKFKIILLSILLFLLALGYYVTSNFFPNGKDLLEDCTMPNLFPEDPNDEEPDRSHYKIYEINGEYYYIGLWNNLGGMIKKKVQILFEDDLALIHEYKPGSEGGISSIHTWRYIDRNGDVVLKPNAFLASGFSEGLAAVIPHEGLNWGYINKKGEIVIEPRYVQTFMFKDGLAAVYDGGKWIQINNKGEYVNDLEFKDGLAAVYDFGKWFLINDKGKYIRELDEPLKKDK